MILLLGASGYIGHAFANELLRRGHAFVPLTRKAIDYASFAVLFDYMRKMRPEFLINASGFTGKPDAAACDEAREETLLANTLLPQTIARACLITNTPWGHVSSGNIYVGAKVLEKGGMRIEQDLHRAEIRELLEQHPERISGFTETDEPNCSFRTMPGSFYSGTKALAEGMIRDQGCCYLWRPGVPFNECEEPRNFLWTIQRSAMVCNSIDSLCHVGDFVRACLDLWEQRAAFGVYHVANRGPMGMETVVRMIQRLRKPWKPEFWNETDHGNLSMPCSARSHAVLETSKLAAAGVEMRAVEDAMDEALRNWQPAASSAQLVFH